MLPSFSPHCCLEDVCLPMNAKTESIRLYSSVPCVTVEPIREVVASKDLLTKRQKPITQTSVESVSPVCVNEPSSELDYNRHSRPFADQLPVANKIESQKSCCLLLARSKSVRISLGVLLGAFFVGAILIAIVQRKHCFYIYTVKSGRM